MRIIAESKTENVLLVTNGQHVRICHLDAGVAGPRMQLGDALLARTDWENPSMSAEDPATLAKVAALRFCRDKH